MINLRNLNWCLRAPMKDFAKIKGATLVDVAPGHSYIYIDRGSNILGVAHADSVCEFRSMKVTENQIRAATVDNRIGLYMMLFGLPYLGINCDVLITDHEEIGQSTAMYFDTDKAYNWMFSFDRAGTDVVCYQYDDVDSWRDSLEAVGFSVGWGSFSDISYLNHLGVCGVNIGCGMEDYHSAKAYVDINHLVLMAAIFRSFWSKNRERKFEYNAKLYEADLTAYVWKNDMHYFEGTDHSQKTGKYDNHVKAHLDEDLTEVERPAKLTSGLE